MAAVLSVVEVLKKLVKAVVVEHVVDMVAEVVVEHQFVMEMVPLIVGFTL